MRVSNPIANSYTKNQANSRFITVNLDDVEPGSPEENLLLELSKKVGIIEDVVDYLYEGTFRIDDWVDASGNEKTNGYNYTQTISLSSNNENAPTITSNSQFLPTIGFYPTGNVSTDESLSETLNIINSGKTTSGNGNITTLVTEKPTTDITVVWAIRTEVSSNG